MNQTNTSLRGQETSPVFYMIPQHRDASCVGMTVRISAGCCWSLTNNKTIRKVYNGFKQALNTIWKSYNQYLMIRLIYIFC